MADTPAEENTSIFDQITAVTQGSDQEYVKEILTVFVEQSLNGIIAWDRNFTNSVNKGISAIDSAISAQITEILHHSDFQTIEGAWRGLNYLVKNSLCGEDLKIKVLDVDKDTLFKNFDKAIEFDQSDLFKKVYEEEYGTSGGHPYDVLIGDYQFKNHPQDIQLLQYISQVSAGAFAPFISAADPLVMGLESWENLSNPTDLARVFESSEYAQWRSFRDTEEASFVCLTLPATLARVPYGNLTVPVETFEYEETEITESGKSRQLPHEHYCWMNSAFVYGTVLTRAFSEYGWCTAIRGVENGGKVDNLNVHVYLSEEGDADIEIPTEVEITDRREEELSQLGFLPFSHYKGEAYAVFFGAQTMNKPKKYDDFDATANAEISARLPYVLAVSRIAHYLKVIARDKIGSFMEVADAEKWLNDWILNGSISIICVTLFVWK
jgi:type VI secretion system protein ImpC